MKFFISSPQINLENSRKAVIDSLESMEFKEVFASENEGSRSQSPIDVCMSAIENCNIFILLLGDKYGSIPNGFNISVTEMEFNKAREFKKDIIIYKLKRSEIENSQKEFIKKVIDFKEGFFYGHEIGWCIF